RRALELTGVERQPRAHRIGLGARRNVVARELERAFGERFGLLAGARAPAQLGAREQRARRLGGTQLGERLGVAPLQAQRLGEREPQRFGRGALRARGEPVARALLGSIGPAGGRLARGLVAERGERAVALPAG